MANLPFIVVSRLLLSRTGAGSALLRCRTRSAMVYLVYLRGSLNPSSLIPVSSRLFRRSICTLGLNLILLKPP